MLARMASTSITRTDSDKLHKPSVRAYAVASVVEAAKTMSRFSRKWLAHDEGLGKRFSSRQGESFLRASLGVALFWV